MKFWARSRIGRARLDCLRQELNKKGRMASSYQPKSCYPFLCKASFLYNHFFFPLVLIITESTELRGGSDWSYEVLIGRGRDMIVVFRHITRYSQLYILHSTAASSIFHWQLLLCIISKYCITLALQLILKMWAAKSGH